MKWNEMGPLRPLSLSVKSVQVASREWPRHSPHSCRESNGASKIDFPYLKERKMDRFPISVPAT